MFLLALILSIHAQAGDHTSYWVSARAADKYARTALVNAGMSIESVVDDMAYGFAPKAIVDKMTAKGLPVVTSFPASEIGNLDFPSQDSDYHDYARITQALQDLAKQNPSLVHLFSIGKSLEGREMWGVRINPSAPSASASTGEPGIIFMGGHHAREHLSVEVPLLLAQFLVSNYGKDSTVTDLVNRRDIYVLPLINPDGAEFDIASGAYQMWRKNRRPGDCAGVDLNRNYGYEWGTGGSSNDNCSDIYMGPNAFSEPETQNVKAFVESKPNVKVLLSFHTYSELILYPWGHTYDPISDASDLAAYKTMATTMAQWNGYTAEQTSQLYIASGDTTDWSYGTLKIFSFTFELSPKQNDFGGFYPGNDAIEKTFQANLKPALYLIDLADDPHRASSRPETTLFFGR